MCRLRDSLWRFMLRVCLRGYASEHHKGVIIERIAYVYMRCKGYRCVRSRYKTPLGEIDLLMARGATLVAVEVKYRPTYDDAARAITPRQQYRIRRSLEQAHKQFPNFLYLRCDSILIFEDKWPIHRINVF